MNGVDARASHEELKAALGNGPESILKLKRAAAPSPESKEPPSGNSLLVPKPEGGLPLPCLPCCALRPGSNA